MSALPEEKGFRKISNSIQKLEDELKRTTDEPTPRQRLQLGPPRRPDNLGALTPICSRKKVLDLPPFQQPPATATASRMKTETETRLREIMPGNGILKIAGVQYKTDVSELEDLGTLGNGTSGHVVRMRHPTTDTTIAVKQMRRTGNHEENRRIIMDIDVVLKSEDCPYIVQCLGCFITECDVWICMELMKTCFDKLLKRMAEPVPEPIIGKITVATVRALSYLKEKHDVIHRDIKPSNILIDEHGNIKLCDFGISGRLVDSKAKTRSAGCAAYMAPERVDPNKSDYDIRADVWSLGITLVELATGSNPYKSCNTEFEVLTRVLEADPPSLSKDRGFSVEFQMFVEKCLTKNHLKRPKYRELLEQPFIRHYEQEVVDVRGWFASVMQSPSHVERPQCLPTTFHPSLSHRSHTLRTTSPTTIDSPAITPTTPTPPTATPAKRIPLPSAAATNAQRSHIPNYMRPNATTHIDSATTKVPSPGGHSPASPTVPSPSGTAATALTPTLSRSSTQLAVSPADLASSHNIATASTTPPIHPTANAIATTPTSPIAEDCPPPPVLLPRMRSYKPVSKLSATTASAAHQTQPPHARHPLLMQSTHHQHHQPQYHHQNHHQLQQQQRRRDADDQLDGAAGGGIVGQMNQLYRRSPFMQRRAAAAAASAADDERSTTTQRQNEAIYSNLATITSHSPYFQRKHLLRKSTPDHHQHQRQHQQPAYHHQHQHHYRQQQLFADPNGRCLPTGSSPSPLANRKRFQTTVPIVEPYDDNNGSLFAAAVRPKGNTSPIVLQRFYHQQNQLRDRQERRQRSATTTTSIENTNPFLSQIPKFRPPNGCDKSQPPQPAPTQQPLSMSPLPPPSPPTGPESLPTYFDTDSTAQVRYVDDHRQIKNQSPKHQHFFGTSPLMMRRKQQQQQQQQHHPPLPFQTSDTMDYGQHQQPTIELKASRIAKPTIGSKTDKLEATDASDPGWFNSLAGVVKRRFASYVKLHLANGAKQQPGGGGGNASPSPAATSATTTTPPLTAASAGDEQRGAAAAFRNMRTDLRPHHRTVSASSAAPQSAIPQPFQQQQHHHHQHQHPYAMADVERGYVGESTTVYGKVLPPNPHVLHNHQSQAQQQPQHHVVGQRQPAPAAGVTSALFSSQQRHRSPDPPPRYNRGQSPLVLRRNLQEYGGSPLFQRRYTASPPMPPPRRGSESVPGSPHNFRNASRIHYTPEPQRHGLFGARTTTMATAATTTDQ